MKDLTYDQQMKLSEMLFKALELGCWHEWEDGYKASGNYAYEWCTHCGTVKKDWWIEPNLFADWTGFGIVWEAVKGREDWLKGRALFSTDSYGLTEIDIDDIATPHFQLEVLRWLVGEDKVKEVVG